MEFRQLRYFVAVADELNFTRAAQKLRVAQPALSRQIRQLEEETGAPLFERGARGAKLTLAGEAFLVEARALLAQSAKALRVAQSFRESKPHSLNVGYAWGLFHSLVPKVIARFHRKRRDVPVNLFDMTAPQQSAAILEDRLDAGFIGFEQDAAGPHLARKRIGSCAFILALPQDHRAAKSKAVDLQSLAEESFCVISTENFPGAAHCATQACAAAGFRPRILQTAARGVTMLGMVAANRGIAILPEPLSELPHPGVIFRPMRDPYLSDLYVVWQARKSGDLIAEFLNAADAQEH